MVRAVPFFLALTLFTAGCMTNGGRFQTKMGEGQPLYHGDVLVWQASDGNGISFNRWLPAERAGRVMVAIPGFDEAACEMAPLGEYFARRGCAVYALDLRGQGRDPNADRRGRFADWNRWVQDLREFTRFVREQHPNAPVYYAAQSLGCIVAVDAVARMAPNEAPAGLILQSPGILFPSPAPLARPVVALGEVATLNQGRVTTPALLDLFHQEIIGNCADEKAWERSPDRVGQGFTYACLNSAFDLGADTAQRLAQVTVPVLMQMGKADPLLKLAEGQMGAPTTFARALGSRHKVLRWYAGNHDLLNDRNTRASLLTDAHEWMTRRR